MMMYTVHANISYISSQSSYAQCDAMQFPSCFMTSAMCHVRSSVSVQPCVVTDALLPAAGPAAVKGKLKQLCLQVLGMNVGD